MTDSPKQVPPYGLRLPPDLKERVQEAAKAANRSMNAEIVARLGASFEDQTAPTVTPEVVSQIISLTVESAVKHVIDLGWRPPDRDEPRGLSAAAPDKQKK